MYDVVIVGAGGFARELKLLLPDCLSESEYRFKGFLGKDQGVGPDETVRQLTLGDPEEYRPQPNDRFVLAIGSMDHRRRVVESIVERGGRFVTMIHPLAFVASTAQLGEGVVIYPYAVVSNEAELQDYAKLNYYASVGHNSRVGKYCLLAPYATVNGFSVLEDEVFMSTHTTVAPVLHVGQRTKLSANSALMVDASPDSFVFGVPGKCVRQVRFE
jgi:sugar O-acyltransferase (sialic acid O-acetyltransferase NeuD family)